MIIDFSFMLCAGLTNTTFNRWFPPKSNPILNFWVFYNFGFNDYYINFDFLINPVTNIGVVIVI